MFDNFFHFSPLFHELCDIKFYDDDDEG